MTATILPAVYSKLPFDPAKDLVPVARLTSSPLVLAVNPNAGINSLQELIATAKRKPDRRAWCRQSRSTAIASRRM